MSNDPVKSSLRKMKEKKEEPPVQANPTNKAYEKLLALALAKELAQPKRKKKKRKNSQPKVVIIHSEIPKPRELPIIYPPPGGYTLPPMPLISHPAPASQNPLPIEPVSQKTQAIGAGRILTEKSSIGSLSPKNKEPESPVIQFIDKKRIRRYIWFRIRVVSHLIRFTSVIRQNRLDRRIRKLRARVLVKIETVDMHFNVLLFQISLSFLELFHRNSFAFVWISMFLCRFSHPHNPPLSRTLSSSLFFSIFDSLLFVFSHYHLFPSSQADSDGAFQEVHWV